MFVHHFATSHDIPPETGNILSLKWDDKKTLKYVITMNYSDLYLLINSLLGNGNEHSCLHTNFIKTTYNKSNLFQHCWRGKNWGMYRHLYVLPLQSQRLNRFSPFLTNLYLWWSSLFKCARGCAKNCIHLLSSHKKYVDKKINYFVYLN